MPVIFNEDTRDKIKNNMLENGFQLIKQYGLKKTSIEKVTQTVGLAKGTFYNFFSSKEDFVNQIVLYKRNEMKKHISVFFKENKAMNKDNLSKLILFFNSHDYNLFQYLTREDITLIKFKIPEFTPEESEIEKTTTTILEYIPNRRKECDWKVVANYMSLLAVIQYSKDEFLQESLDKNINGILSLLMNEIFE